MCKIEKTVTCNWKLQPARKTQTPHYKLSNPFDYFLYFLVRNNKNLR
jgi:hypothetical protein